jgi:hypothetical protein
MRRGVVLAGASALDEALGLYVGARYVFIDALEVRGMSFAVSYKRLAKIGQLAIGAALVEGRIVAALDVADPSEAAQGLLLTATGRNEAVMLLGAHVLDVGAFPLAGPHAVAFRDDEAIVASVERLFSELEGHAWALRHGTVPEVPDWTEPKEVYGLSDGQSSSARRERNMP